MKVIDRNSIKRYVMVNEEVNAKVECNEKYLGQWLGRGFHIRKIVYLTKEAEGTKLTTR